MGSLKAWLLGIVLTSFAAGLARQLAPQGKEQAMVRLACGLLLALAILRPLAGQNLDAFDFSMDGFRLEASDVSDLYRKNQQDTLSAIIAEKTEAYICDKANRLGVPCEATVTVSLTESGVPLPGSVTIRGAYSEELAECLEKEVGIPAGMQFWLEEE